MLNRYTWLAALICHMQDFCSGSPGVTGKVGKSKAPGL